MENKFSGVLNSSMAKLNGDGGEGRELNGEGEGGRAKRQLGYHRQAAVVEGHQPREESLPEVEGKVEMSGMAKILGKKYEKHRMENTIFRHAQFAFGQS